VCGFAFIRYDFRSVPLPLCSLSLHFVFPLVVFTARSLFRLHSNVSSLCFASTLFRFFVFSFQSSSVLALFPFTLFRSNSVHSHFSFCVSVHCVSVQSVQPCTCFIFFVTFSHGFVFTQYDFDSVPLPLVSHSLCFVSTLVAFTFRSPFRLHSPPLRLHFVLLLVSVLFSSHCCLASLYFVLTPYIFTFRSVLGSTVFRFHSAQSSLCFVFSLLRFLSVASSLNMSFTLFRFHSVSLPLCFVFTLVVLTPRCLFPLHSDSSSLRIVSLYSALRFQSCSVLTLVAFTVFRSHFVHFHFSF
jgi:hypothetical protein